MKTNKKIKFVVPILAAIFLFVTAAVCTQCGQQAGAPTIKLEIYEGPTYSASDDACYYSIEAIVTGTPGPEIEFGEDDNVKSLGNNRVRVGVEVGNSFILTATATNTAGLASASITLIGEVIDEGEAAEGEEISGEIIEDEEISAEAADEEEADGGEIADAEEDEEAEDEEAEDEEEIKTDILTCIEDESGTVTSIPGDNWSGVRAESGPIYIGDDPGDNTCMGYMSFDTSQLIGSTIISANLYTVSYDIFPVDGDNSFFEVMYLQSVYYGPRPLIPTDNDLPFERLASFPTTISNINYSGDNLATSIQKSLDEGKTRYQVRLVWAMTTDGDEESDGIAYWPRGSFLSINYR